MPKRFARWVPAIFIIISTVLFVALGGTRFVSIAEIGTHYEALSGFVEENLLLSLLGFTIAYILFVAILVVPPSAPLSLVSGLLFGTLGGTLVCMVAKTIGGSIAFLGWRYSFRGYEGLMSPRVMKLSEAISKRGFWYLMVARLMPLFPFGTVTLAATFTRIQLPTFFGATFVGQGPASFIYASFGASLGVLLSQGDDVDFDALNLTSEFLIPTVLLIVLSVAGVAAGHLVDPERAERQTEQS